jgi:hypothetical protein
MWFAAPPPPPVSFSREVAPIMALHCNTCHGDAGGFSTRSHRELLLGGNLGTVIVPGNPDNSLLIHFLDGRRGEKHRMPKDGPPLSTDQIATIRRWIAEGARNDNLPVKTYRITRQDVPIGPEKPTRVFCRVDTKAYLVLTIFNPRNHRVLWSDVAVSEPGKRMTWDLRAGSGWPEAVTLELALQYAEAEPHETEFYAQPPE